MLLIQWQGTGNVIPGEAGEGAGIKENGEAVRAQPVGQGFESPQDIVEEGAGSQEDKLSSA